MPPRKTKTVAVAAAAKKAARKPPMARTTAVVSPPGQGDDLDTRGEAKRFRVFHRVWRNHRLTEPPTREELLGEFPTFLAARQAATSHIVQIAARGQMTPMPNAGLGDIYFGGAKGGVEGVLLEEVGAPRIGGANPSPAPWSVFALVERRRSGDKRIGDTVYASRASADAAAGQLTAPRGAAIAVVEAKVWYG
ncbi:uncharacterized protein LOC62_03G004952 [Vanrija pseudolonga]|uniref:Uncharacterized protein n=1 Tax=Vanrija pseudolonga TaxID=143232 RepID=A0AAF0YCQ7_9TREE|nr:hypothetical protein LOC62_03G004952 [Vanrija pseudolonga]